MKWGVSEVSCEVSWDISQVSCKVSTEVTCDGTNEVESKVNRSEKRFRWFSIAQKLLKRESKIRADPIPFYDFFLGGDDEKITCAEYVKNLIL